MTFLCFASVCSHYQAVQGVSLHLPLCSFATRHPLYSCQCFAHLSGSVSLAFIKFALFCFSYFCWFCLLHVVMELLGFGLSGPSFLTILLVIPRLPPHEFWLHDFCCRVTELSDLLSLLHSAICC